MENTKMGYVIYTNNMIKIEPSARRKISFQSGFDIADKVANYLKKNNAVLVIGLGELSSKDLGREKSAKNWIYHLKDTTFFADFSPYHGMYSGMKIVFATEGKKAKKILNDLQSIVDHYQ